MKKSTLQIALTFTLLWLLASAAALLYWYRPSQEQLQLSDGAPLILTSPASHASYKVLLALPQDQLYSTDELLELAKAGNARIAQYPLAAGNCKVQWQRLNDALQQLGGADLVAGSGAGAALAWRWLASQGKETSRAISVGFSMKNPDCNAVLPQQLQHGHWLAAWNDNPDDTSARFVRLQPNSETLIGNYDTSLKELLRNQLLRALSGESEAMPVVEVPSSQASDTVTLFYSGDGGWRDLDRDVAAEMAKRGYPVVGIDALRYFWQHKSPQQGAADLSQLMQLYREKWGAKHFVLAGYSFGADVLPAFYNHLPSADQQAVDAILLLALARSGSFEIEVQGWLGKAGEEAATGPELLRLPGTKVLCVYGSEEAEESGCTLAMAPGEQLQLPGGHHYDGNYPALAERLLLGIRQRQSTTSRD